MSFTLLAHVESQACCYGHDAAVDASAIFCALLRYRRCRFHSASMRFSPRRRLAAAMKTVLIRLNDCRLLTLGFTAFRRTTALFRVLACAARFLPPNAHVGFISRSRPASRRIQARPRIVLHSYYFYQPERNARFRRGLMISA